MIDCKVTENYFKEKRRMTEGCLPPSCRTCELAWDKNGKNLSCNRFEPTYPLEAIAIIQAWSNANPIKTYLSDFLEKFPRARKEDVTDECCVNTIYFGQPTCIFDLSDDKDCTLCWNRPLEEN